MPLARKALAPGGVVVMTQSEHDKILKEISDLRARVVALEVDGDLNADIEMREVSDRRAADEIAEYFRLRDGEEIFPSDVAAGLSLAYDQVSRVITELLSNGKIVLADSSDG